MFRKCVPDVGKKAYFSANIAQIFTRLQAGRSAGHTHNVRPFRVGLGRPQRLSVLRHIQDVGAQFRGHDERALTLERGLLGVMDAKFAGCK